MQTIGFLGLGAMGAGMAANLARAGHEVRAFDLSPDAMAQAAAAGLTPASSAADAGAGADAIVTMLPAGAHVRAAYEGDLFAAARSDAVLIDCSTIDVATARALGEASAARGLLMVDAPVSGGVAAAQGGTLTFMVGGPDAAFARAEPILKAMGRAVIHAGGPGAGQAAKICNNMLLAIGMIGTCEAFTLARALGLADQTFFDIASKASGQCWSLTSYCPVPGPVPASPANRDYQAGFQAALMLKDLRLAMEAARGVGAATPMGAQAEALYALFAKAADPATDFSGIIRMLDGTLPSRPA
jgi:3-hydroxyisobutyrate dehydrogenase